MAVFLWASQCEWSDRDTELDFFTELKPFGTAVTLQQVHSCWSECYICTGKSSKSGTIMQNFDWHSSHFDLPRKLQCLIFAPYRQRDRPKPDHYKDSHFSVNKTNQTFHNKIIDLKFWSWSLLFGQNTICEGFSYLIKSCHTSLNVHCFTVWYEQDPRTFCEGATMCEGPPPKERLAAPALQSVLISKLIHHLVPKTGYGASCDLCSFTAKLMTGAMFFNVTEVCAFLIQAKWCLSTILPFSFLLLLCYYYNYLKVIYYGWSPFGVTSFKKN